jgi:hypothetical protein
VGKRDGMSVKLSARERIALAAIAARAEPSFQGAMAGANGCQLSTALGLAGHPSSDQGAHQTAASLVRKGLVYKDRDARGHVWYGPLTVDGTEALGGADAAGYDREVICGGCGDEWNLRPGEDMKSCPSCGSREILAGS